MTPSELLILIQGDPTALALATAGNDEACTELARLQQALREWAKESGQVSND